MTSHADWLAGLKVGDEVAVRSGWFYCAYSTSQVASASRLYVTVNRNRYRRSDGGCTGARGLSIVEPTEEVIAAIRRAHLLNRISCVNFNSLTTQQLERIMAIVDGVELTTPPQS